LSYETDDIFFCHAGVRPGVELRKQSEEDLLWIREEFHNYMGRYSKLIVHGHTPIEQATHYTNRVNLDSGSGYGKSLTAAVFEENKCYSLNPKGRVQLLPTK